MTSLLAYDPLQRPSAAEALLGSYLNFDCSTGGAPLPAPQPWTLEGLFVNAGELAGSPGHKRQLVAEECVLHDDEAGAAENFSAPLAK